jgi:hypothetical protein
MRAGVATIRQTAARAAALAACLLTASTALAAGRPPAAAPVSPATGRYAATLCVANAAQPPSCGPAELDLRAGGKVRVQVSDIVYRLLVGPGPALVVVMQGAMQIDEFAALARWDGEALHFADLEKQLRYEVRLGAPKRSVR